jgi:hypothetical protein
MVRNERRTFRRQLVGLFQQRLCIWWCQKTFFGKEFEPIERFVGFLQAVPNLGNELRLGTGAVRFAVVGTH